MKIKKPILLIAAVAALAVAVPSTAGAAEGTCPAEMRCPVGTQINLTGSGITLTTTLFGPIKCKTIDLGAVIFSNNGTTFAASGNNVGPNQVGCEYGAGHPINVTNFNIAPLEAKEGGVAGLKFGALSFTSEVDLPGGVTCKFTGTNVKFEYTRGQDNIKFTEAGGITSTGCGGVKLDGEFTIETTAKKPVLLD